ncbi:MAG: UDP-N-acetylglucosamine 1-carboxyvinyltransferase [Candidatus Pacebacteria bacterium]|nr:UDP-N-acetylglucosamine 1-carboxyvinyltransferase [Candidatus Paceibacterota bacterium]
MNKDKFLIKGLAGQRTLKGEIPVGGAKNAALKMVAATLLFKDDIELKNVPNIEDIKKIIELVEDIGFGVTSSGENSYVISPKERISTVLSPEIAGKIRSSVVLTGPLLARTGRVVFPHPGGCVIGARPIDFFLKSYEQMGAKVKETKDKYIIEAKDGKLVGAKIFLPIPSVTVTETIMMTGILAKGVTTIRNAALEPEIEYLAKFLNKCGANIQGAGTPTIIIRGGPLLKAGGLSYVTMPDRIEAGSFLVLAALAAEDVSVTKCNPDHLEAIIDVLRQTGVKIDVGKDSVRVTYNNKNKKKEFKSVNIKTHEYPGFPTDLQAPMTVFLTQATGESLVHETIFEGRLSYAESLERMGADITPMDPHRMLVRGLTPLRGKKLESPDLRAGLAFVLAAIVAKGDSAVHNVYNIDRGYESVEKRLQKIGVDISRVAE